MSSVCSTRVNDGVRVRTPAGVVCVYGVHRRRTGTIDVEYGIVCDASLHPEGEMGVFGEALKIWSGELNFPPLHQWWYLW